MDRISRSGQCPGLYAGLGGECNTAPGPEEFISCQTDACADLESTYIMCVAT